MLLIEQTYSILVSSLLAVLFCVALFGWLVALCHGCTYLHPTLPSARSPTYPDVGSGPVIPFIFMLVGHSPRAVLTEPACFLTLSISIEDCHGPRGGVTSHGGDREMARFVEESEALGWTVSRTHRDVLRGGT